MNTNPINLAVRFLLEILMLVTLANWGWHLTPGWTRYLFTPSLPASAAALWGIFRIQNDPKPAPVEIPGPVRLLLELSLFALMVWCLYDLAYRTGAWISGIVIVIHYIISYDRTWAMLRNKPYKGFAKQR
ncbi:MAG: YrdB family protein [Bacteroidetes bacterium]|nr:YrdB family protein [Bacteroidota bacterium]